jgi:predicted anti-sigma-YlaC factor YlaD
MNCEELFRLLPEYLEAETKLELCKELEAHVRECSYCRAHLHTMKETISLAHELSAPCVHHEWVNRLRERVVRSHGQASE